MPFSHQDPVVYHTNPFDWGYPFEQLYSELKAPSPTGTTSTCDSSDDDSNSSWPFDSGSSRFAVGFNRPVETPALSITLPQQQQQQQKQDLKSTLEAAYWMSRSYVQAVQRQPQLVQPSPSSAQVSVISGQQQEQTKRKKRFPSSRKSKNRPKYH